jgi:hypothetical protein
LSCFAFSAPPFPPPPPPPPPPPALWLGLGAVLLALGAYVVAAARSRFTLRGDALVLEEPFVTRRLRRGDIAGRRLIPLQHGMTALDLLPARPRDKKIRIGNLYRRDAALDAWLEPIPDLDRQDREAAEAELQRTLAEAAPGDAGARSLRSARLAARVLFHATWIACAWAFFRPEPYAAAMATLALLPVAALAVALRWRGIVRVDERRNDPRPNVALALIAPGAILALRCIRDLKLVEYAPALVAAAVAAVALAALAALADPSLRARKPMVALFAALLLMWGYGAVVQADVLLDRASPESFTVEVVGKSVTHGKTTSWNLRLAPWGPCAEAESVEVTEDQYDAVREGDVVETLLRPGALGIRWYVVRL